MSRKTLSRAKLSSAYQALFSAVICTTPGMPADVQRGMYFFWLDGLFIALSFSFYNAFMSLFLIGFGASNSEVGLMSSLASLFGAVAYLFSTRAAKIIGSNKRAVVLSRIISRIILLIVAVLPMFVSGKTAIYLTIVLACFRVIMESIGAPAWTALVAEIVPLPVRARYIASRNTIKNLAATLGVAMAGELIRAIGFPGGYQVSFVLAAIIGFIAAYAYARIPINEEPAAARAAKIAADNPSKPANLVGYAFARTVWTLGNQIAAPFYFVYLVRSLAGNESTVGLLSSSSSIAAIVGLFILSRAVDRFGLRRTWLVASLIETATPLLWAIAPAAWFCFFPAITDGLLISGLELVNLNTILLLTNDNNRTRFIATSSACLSVANMIGPLIGGAVSDSFGFKTVFSIGAGVCMVGFVLYAIFVNEDKPRLKKPIPPISDKSQ